jgi:hypothetical protein
MICFASSLRHEPSAGIAFPSPDKSYTGVKTINKRVIGDDVTKIMVVEGREEKRPLASSRFDILHSSTLLPTAPVVLAPLLARF